MSIQLCGGMQAAITLRSCQGGRGYSVEILRFHSTLKKHCLCSMGNNSAIIKLDGWRYRKGHGHGKRSTILFLFCALLLTKVVLVLQERVWGYTVHGRNYTPLPLELFLVLVEWKQEEQVFRPHWDYNQRKMKRSFQQLSFTSHFRSINTPLLGQFQFSVKCVLVSRN